MEYWSKLVRTISETLFPDRKSEREKAEKTKILEDAAKQGEVKLRKFEDAPVIKAKPKRARTVKGKYKGDDKSTADVNEAWVGGKAPKKKYTYKEKKK
tara:strand:- start:175 stop:468 length:294 start_codon:yes stop_codon:yes gene_type:complete